MENKVYNWYVKNGNILVQKNGHRILLQLNYENSDGCLLTTADTNEIIDLLIQISKKIWEDPSYQRQPYASKLFNDINNEYHWEIESSQLVIKYNEIEEAIELRYTGNSIMNLELNYVVEMVQVMEQLNK